uniref:SRCR domain-containing protein n=1 Tax=Catharus ustulatus TaxID=91951 RepID=A0A8C3VA93_CATUS
RGRGSRAPSSHPQPGPSVPAGSRRVRLVGSSGRCAGRVEVYSGGSWSSVCQEGWDLQDAAVVCRELGCGRALEAPSSARFGGERECGRGVGAGAVCSGQWRAAPEQGPAEAAGGWWPCRDPAAPLAEQISVRLAGGRGRCRGSLEVSYNGTWGRVCSNGTSTGTAGTVCRQLGCGERGWLSADTAQPRGAGTGPLWPYMAECSGSEESLWECGRSEERECGRGVGAGAVCSEQISLRLVGGGGRCAGRVEVKHDGEWGSVCVFDFDRKALWASVVCRQLGCGRVARASSYAPFGQGTGRIWLQPYFCNGTENGLEECQHFGWGRHFCDPGWHAGVTCTGEGTRWPCWDSRVVLEHPGRPRSCAGSWAAESRSPWPAVAGLGRHRHRSGTAASSAMAPSPSSVPVPGVRPRARAAAAVPASSAPVSAGNTGGSWAPCSIPALTALPATAYTGFRLGNGSSGCSGRVEVAVRGTWGSVCASEWDLPDAHVLCRHLGCGRALSVPPGGSFGSGEGPLRPDTFGCSGSERHPGQCPVTVLGKAPCAPGNAAAVNCSGLYDISRRSGKGF